MNTTRFLWLVVFTLGLGMGMSRAPAAQFNVEGKPLVEPAQKVSNEPAEAPGERLRIAAYNIENFMDGVDDSTNSTPERAARQARMAARVLEDIHPDILIVDEVENGTALTLLNKSLTKPFPVAYVADFGSGSNSQQPNKHNIGVLSRVALGAVDEIDFGPLSGKGRPPRGVLRVNVPTGEKTSLVLYGIHLKSNWGRRDRNMAQRMYALEVIRKDADTQLAAHDGTEVMVLGDFNTDPDHEDFSEDITMRPMDGWKDLWRGYALEERTTLPTRHGDPNQEFPPVCFDRFVVSPALTQAPWVVQAPQRLVTGVNTTNVFVEPGDDGHISDHFPIFVDVERGASP